MLYLWRAESFICVLIGPTTSISLADAGGQLHKALILIFSNDRNHGYLSVFHSLKQGKAVS